MTWESLGRRIAKMTPEQLKQKVNVFEGSSGSWKEVDAVYVARKDEYPDECAPGERRYEEFKKFGETIQPAVVRGQHYIIT